MGGGDGGKKCERGVLISVDRGTFWVTNSRVPFPSTMRIGVTELKSVALELVYVNIGVNGVVAPLCLLRVCRLSPARCLKARPPNKPPDEVREPPGCIKPK